MFDPHAFDDEHQHVMNPVSTFTGMTKLAAGHLRDHALSLAPKPDLADVLTQSARSPIIEVIEKHKRMHKKLGKRSIDNYDAAELRYPFKSPILLKKPKNKEAAIEAETDESKNACDARDIHMEGIGEHLVSPIGQQTTGRMAELNEDAAETSQPNYRVRRSEDVPKKQPEDGQEEVHGSGTLDCPFHKHSDSVCSHGTCTKSQ